MFPAEEQTAAPKLVRIALSSAPRILASGTIDGGGIVNHWPAPPHRIPAPQRKAVEPNQIAHVTHPPPTTPLLFFRQFTEPAAPYPAPSGLAPTARMAARSLRLIIRYYVRNRNAKKPLEVTVSGFSSFWALSGQEPRKAVLMRDNFINAAACVKPPAWEPPPAWPA